VYLSDVFILAFLLLIWCWNLPEDLPGRILIRPFSKIVVWLGLWHGWSMFAPIPLRVSRRVAIQVEYADGTKLEWRPPGSIPVGYWRSFLHALHRKFTDQVCAGKIKNIRWCMADVALRRLAAKFPQKPVPIHVAVIEESWAVNSETLKSVTGDPKRTVLFEQRLATGVLK
jgi:hypothetical protein